MEHRVRIELTSERFASSCLTIWLSVQNGALGRSRTCNLLVRSQTLSPVELRVREMAVPARVERATLKLTASCSATELRDNKLVGPVGLEPTTYRLRGESSTIELRSHKMAGVTGFDPATSTVTVSRSNQLSYTPINELLVRLHSPCSPSLFSKKAQSVKNGTDGRNRTLLRRVWRPLHNHYTTSVKIGGPRGN